MRAPPVLIGRGREQQILSAVVESALASNGSTLVVRGELGVGKTALLGGAAADAEARGMTVLEVAAVETEAQLPYAGLHQLLRSLLGGEPTRSRQLWDAALNRSGEDETPVERFRLALSVLTSVTSKAGAGRLLVVDDAQ